MPSSMLSRITVAIIQQKPIIAALSLGHQRLRAKKNIVKIRMMFDVKAMYSKNCKSITRSPDNSYV